MIDSTVTYLGLKLKNPLVASASPFTKKVDSAKRLEDAGVAAIVMDSLFEEQINYESNELDHFLNFGTDANAEFSTYFPDLGHYNMGPEAYLEKLHKIREAVSLPVIASLNGVSEGGWVTYAQKMEQAGASALELNIYYLPASAALTGDALEDEYIRLTRQVRSKIKIPLAIKLSPFFTSIPNMAKRLADAGANGLVLFNRFYQPDLDLESLEVVPDIKLSTSDDMKLPLRWIAILFGRVEADLALTSGVHTGLDLIKGVMVGASAVMTTSALVQHGPMQAGKILREALEWMEKKEYTSFAQMKGSMSQKSVAGPAAFERANYMKSLKKFDTKIRY